ncbi:hypothetical protein SAMN05421780_1205 [Flexibacter flexilis DSM 6793]|uniref:Uncharacterized protein n=1 Tax=Flexibacter flexilis DSM 6793 TaxID=927664 RepID=A0A1I1NV92_9BACT|nr:hypothetical protein [Flexibacter flexilis]SFD01242.1 hypothetical protein SAMN05421780_1205 [Flexibacter flexilis DSM 6793]
MEMFATGHLMNGELTLKNEDVTHFQERVQKVRSNVPITEQDYLFRPPKVQAFYEQQKQQDLDKELDNQLDNIAPVR